MRQVRLKRRLPRSQGFDEATELQREGVDAVRERTSGLTVLITFKIKVRIKTKIELRSKQTVANIVFLNKHD